MTGSRRTCASLMRTATSSVSSSIRAATMSLVISSRTGVSGPCPSATPRTAMSRSVIMPISRSPSVTGIAPASAWSMKLAASRALWSGRTVRTSRVITSLTFMETSPALGISRKTNARERPFLSLRHVLRQEVVGRHQLILLVEDLDRPADYAGVLALQRFRTDGQLDAERIAGIERRQKTQILEAGVGQHGAGVGIDEQAGGEAQD